MGGCLHERALHTALRGLWVDAEHKGIYLLLLAFHATQALGKENERGMKMRVKNNCKAFEVFLMVCRYFKMNPTFEKFKDFCDSNYSLLAVWEPVKVR